MTVKQAEADFKSLCTRNNIWAKKWDDVRHCPHCHRLIFMTQRVNDQDLLRQEEEQESIVDYLIFTGNTPHWVECKGMGGSTRLALSDIKPKQRNFLQSWTDKGVECWLFVTLGDGRAPRGRKAWLIPWSSFRVVEMEICEPHNLKSLLWRSPAGPNQEHSMSELFKREELVWKDSNWAFPETHYMVVSHGVLTLPKLY